MSAAACARRAALFVCLLAAARAGATSWTTDARSLQKVADGVWVIIHKDAVLAGWPQGNTTVVIGRRGVLVVDACFLTSSAREDIADIRRLTSKPVRWLVNTHFHIDHNAGNSAYKDAFPGVEIIAQSATRRFMDDTNPAFAANVIAPDGRPSTELLPAMRRALASGHDDGGNALSAADRALTVRQIHDIEGEIADYRHYRYEPPTLLFERALTLDLGDRQVVVEHLGRGNTPGDASVWLPRERVLATGDLLTGPIPYMRMGYPREQLEVLRTLRGRDARVIVPGHGAVQTDPRPLDDVIALLQSVVDQVHEQTAKLPMNSKTKRKSADDLHIDLGAFQKRMAGDDPVNLDFWQNIVEGLGGTANQGLVGRAFDEETGKL